jgi:hypothetical protein
MNIANSQHSNNINIVFNIDYAKIVATIEYIVRLNVIIYM